ncbi:BZ3500_MvSof-1268-A1-R1_Chr1-3g02293 [Microbotryum saponariae]|uniref:BZ3500_MvSof-1268-A1-R1_Chr1-3g02293 protein n=1 Tax=Microbotryum saponariae TaxID=289078 RepID=A0A2X0LAE2_9BASI|nr:BZ3500_MvSof-1268-A1-R1_Chr1-3g02293 [Microbotryum saponariae]SCZ95901.1 BZ3501_MvSof-1269-A2-R1_Chr1-3g01896 [Microbotryum saponariae]
MCGKPSSTSVLPAASGIFKKKSKATQSAVRQALTKPIAILPMARTRTS